jgi:hypothetical protein
MIRTKTRARRVPTWGLMPLMAATLLICFLILMQLLSPNQRNWVGCTSETLKTTAVYLEHIGDEDKPIASIVIAASRPNERELECGAPRFWMSPRVFLVTDEELAEANKLLKGSKRSGEGTAEPREFRYVLVSKLGTVESGVLDGTQSGEFFTSLATYFYGRQPEPELHEYLVLMAFIFGGKDLTQGARRLEH